MRRLIAGSPAAHGAALRVLLLACLAGRPLFAQQEGASFEVHGFLMGNYSARTTGRSLPGGAASDFLLAEERLRLNLSAWADTVEASARVEADFLHDAVAGASDLDLRQAYLDYSTGSFDFRLGRQIATWGVGDLLFINDVFPKDWESFFAGRPLEYLKIGVDGFRARYSSAVANADLIVIPFFTPDRVPTRERFFLFDPFASIGVRNDEPPASTYGNMELGLRLYRRVGAFDLSLYAYRGFWRTPAIRPDDPAAPTRLTTIHPALRVYGASAQGSAWGGVLSAEAGYYDSRDDRDGTDAALPNSQARFLLGYQRQVWREATLTVQYYAEVMQDHAAYAASLLPGMPVQSEYRDLFMLRFEQLLRHESLKLVLVCFLGPADRDYLLQPQITYRLSDRLQLALGANVFGGQREWTSFGQLDGNDNVYLSVRMDF